MEAAGLQALTAAIPPATSGHTPPAGEDATAFADLLHDLAAGSGATTATAAPPPPTSPPADPASPPCLPCAPEPALSGTDFELEALHDLLRDAVPEPAADGVGKETLATPESLAVPVEGTAMPSAPVLPSVPDLPSSGIAFSVLPPPTAPAAGPAPSSGPAVTGNPTTTPASVADTTRSAPTAHAGATDAGVGPTDAPAPPSTMDVGAACLDIPPAAPGAEASPAAPGGMASSFVVPANAAPTAQAPAAAPPPVPAPQPADPPREQLRWQFDGTVQEAHLSLAPDGLGAIDLHVQVEEGAVRLHLSAAEGITRELLSEGLPRLRERLGDSGLSLGQTSVTTSQDGQRGAQTPSARPGGARTSGQGEVTAPVVRRGQGLLDHYA